MPIYGCLLTKTAILRFAQDDKTKFTVILRSIATKNLELYEILGNQFPMLHGHQAPPATRTKIGTLSDSAKGGYGLVMQFLHIEDFTIIEF